MDLSELQKERMQMKPFDMIVLAGQSNSEGFGIGPVSREYVPDDRILWLNDAARPRFEPQADGKDALVLDRPSPISITVADEPVEEAGKVGKPALAFARAYVADGSLAQGRSLLVLNAGVGGTGFRDDQWGVGRGLYQRLKAFTSYALSLDPENRLVAFLWHQGECDSVENPDWEPEKRYAVHKENLQRMLADFKAEFSCPELPVIAGGFCDEWYLKNKQPCDAVLRAIREVCREQGAFVETAGLKSNNQQCGNGDDIHFCREASHILGEKYYQAWKALEAQRGEKK